MNGVSPPRNETVPASRWRQGDQSRPWTALEAAAREEDILATWADALDALREIAVEAAQAEHAWRKASALAYASVVGKNAQERDAKAYLLMEAEADDTDGMHPREARDYWAALETAQKEKCRWLAQEARFAHSLVVSARDGEGLVR